MHRNPSIQDPARQWRQFCRTGQRMAGLVAALWLGFWATMFRVAPPSPSGPREAAAILQWWPPEQGLAAAGVAADARTLWSPAAFALPTPAGFSHFLRTERSRLTPPVQGGRPAPAYLPFVRPMEAPAGKTWRPVTALAPPEARTAPGVAGVGPPRTPGKEDPRLFFPEGWESRLFSGIDLDFGTWTNVAWSAEMEMRFDERGVPVSMLLAESSGWPEVDRRLARSAYGWRLLEPAAPRQGTVAWRNPPAPAAAAAPVRNAP